MTSLMIVDDQPMIRAGLRTILAGQPDIEIVAEAGDGLQAVEILLATPVDVVLMDIRMPGIDGVEATRRVRAAWTSEQVKVIALTTFDHDADVLAALRAGANGFLSKGVGPAELVAAIRDVVSGGGVLSTRAAAALIDHVVAGPTRAVDESLAAAFNTLTARELTIVVAVASGQSNEEIAAELFLSPFTVKTHANRAMVKMGAASRAQLVAFAYQAGLVG